MNEPILQQQVKAFVKRMYTVALDRPAEMEGLELLDQPPSFR